MKRFIRLASYLSAGLGLISLIRLRPTLMIPFFPSFRSVVVTLSPFSALIGAATAAAALMTGLLDAIIAGVIGAGLALHTMWRVNPTYQPFPPRLTAPTVEEDVSIGGVLCDVWHPTATPSGLVIINLHGGAWFTGDKGFGVKGLFTHLAAEGHQMVDVAYPLAPDATLNYQLEAIRNVIAAYRETYRVFVMGASSGGHLALMAAYTTPGVAGVIAYSPPADLANLLTDHYTWDRAASFVKEGREAWLADRSVEEASPLMHVDETCPPTLLLHGEADKIVPPEQSDRMCQALESAGVPVTRITYPGAGHAFEIPVWAPSGQAAMRDVISFMRYKI